MKTKNQSLLNNHIVWYALGTAAILMIPFLAMQFNTGVNWSLSDFIIIGVLLFGAGLLFEFLTKMMPKHKLAIGVVVVLGVLYVWAELAVGIFTNLGS